MKKILFIALLAIQTSVLFGQSSNKIINTPTPSWSLDLTIGYWNIVSPNIGPNVWLVPCVSKSFKKFTIGGFVGVNQYIRKGNETDFRIGASINYNIIKW